MLVDRKNWSLHKRWFWFTLALLIAMSAGYAAASLNTSEWPGGSSLIGFIYGILGGLIILFEGFLYIRKNYLRAWRIGQTQVWLRAHIWLGLLTVPLLVFHSGLRLGGPLSTVLMALLFIVVISGIWGVVVQQIIPRRMLDEVPAETIYGQIGHLAGLMSADAERLVLATCGPAEGDARAELVEQNTASGIPLTIGAVRAAGAVQGKVLMTRAGAVPVADAEPLRKFFEEFVDPYLREGNRRGSPLASTIRAAGMFQTLQTRLPPESHEVTRALENLCEQRRQLDLQGRLHFWLHNWLLLHLPLSGALIVLMVVHVFVALKYW